MTGNAAKDASTKCKQQHGEKIIEKSLPGTTSEPGEVSPVHWLLLGLCRETSGILAIKTLPLKSYCLPYGSISELKAKSGTFCTWHCTNMQRERLNKELKQAKTGKTEARSSRWFAEWIRSSTTFFLPMLYAFICAVLWSSWNILVNTPRLGEDMGPPQDEVHPWGLTATQVRAGSRELLRHGIEDKWLIQAQLAPQKNTFWSFGEGGAA